MPRIFAHRGASGLTGEDNTLRSFARAIELGCDGVEFDVRRSADGKLVCFHDPDVNGRPVGDMTLAELREHSGTDVPELVDAVKLCAGQLALDVELKEPGYEAEVATVLQDVPVRQLTVTSFDPSALRGMRLAMPAIPVGMLVGRPPVNLDPRVHLERSLTHMVDLRSDILAIHHAYIRDELFAENLLPEGVQLYVWTVNDAEEMKRVTAWPISVLITDRPDIAQELLKPLGR
jgi:glycerophosphoryl diester phosphodiesterase